MMRSRMYCIYLCMIAVVLAFFGQAGAYPNPVIQVTPSEIDFGIVEAGGSATVEITIANIGDDPLLLHAFSFKAGSDACFSYRNPDKTTLEPPNGHLDTTTMQVTFSPTTVGVFSAVLVMYNSDPNNKYVEVFLGGEAPDDEITIDDIITFFDESVEAGTLYGKTGCRQHHHHHCKKKGKCHHHKKCKCDKAGRMRLRIFRRMLVATKHALEKDCKQWACLVLKRAYKRSDGEKRPRDFVDGPARGELNSMIQTLRDQLGCKI